MTTDRISDDISLPELTLRGIVLGALLTVVFTASNIYLGLKVGLTFSSAIPAAVISMAVLRMFSSANILENNMVQTQASAAGTLSSIIFILPGLVMMGYWQGFPFWQTFGICAAGGMLGVMFTIPLRHAMVVQSDLPYPEGVAAAEILRIGSDHAAGAEGGTIATAEAGAGRMAAGSGVKDIAAGGVVSALMAFATGGLRIFADSISGWFSVGSAVFRLPLGFSLALVGAGYLIGIVAGIAMLIGLLISWGLAVPILTAGAIMPPGMSIAKFATGLWSTQVRFLGAGVIGIAAIWTLATLFKPMVAGVRTSFAALRDAGGAGRMGGGGPRTQRDLSPRWIIVITLALVAALAVVFGAFLSDVPLTSGVIASLVIYGVIFAFVFGFLIAAACGYMAGLVGSSASPISGIGIVAVILVSLLLLAIGQANGMLHDPAGRRLAIALAIFTTSAVVAVATISNDNLQDLKTGWLVGATPWRQQVALLIGCVVGALVIPPILVLLYNAYGFAGALPHAGMDPGQALSAPQATLMTAIAMGIFTHKLNWTMIVTGLLIGVVLIIIDLLLKRRQERSGGVARLPVLAVGIGIYLPPTISAPLVIGAVIAWLLERRLRRGAVAAGVAYDQYAAHANRRGVLIASGLIVGESLVGVILAGVIGVSGSSAPLAIVGAGFAPTAEWLGLLVFAGVCWWFSRRTLAAAG